MESENTFDRCIHLTKKRLQLQKRLSVSSKKPETESNDSGISVETAANELEHCIKYWYRNYIQNFENEGEWHPIHLAAALGRVDFISEILGKEPTAANSKYINGPACIITPLMCAAAAGSVDTMKFLVENEATFSENPMQEIEWAIIGKSVECFYFIVSRARFKMTLKPIEILHLFLMGLLEDDAEIFEAVLNLPKMFSQNVSNAKTMQVSQLIIVSLSEMLYFTLKKAFFGVLEVLLRESFVLNELNASLPALHFSILNHNDDETAAKLVALLLKYGAPVNQFDMNRKTALAHAANRGFTTCFSSLIQAEAEINMCDMKDMNERVPNFFKTHFDNLITAKLLTPSPSGETVSIDVRFMGVANNFSEIHNIERRAVQQLNEINLLIYIINDGQEELMLHPVIQTYLEKKWTRFLKTYFYISYAFYLLQLLCFTQYTSTTYAADSDFMLINISRCVNGTKENMSIGGNFLLNDGSHICSFNGFLFYLATWVGTCLLAVTRAMSCVSAVLLGSFKLKYVQHIYEVFLVGTVITSIAHWVPLSWFTENPMELQRATASVAVLLAWCYCLFYLERHSSLGIYVEMLGKVLKNFTVFFLTYMCFLVGYALSFSILFKGAEPFHSTLSAAKEIAKMMLGESEFDRELESDLPSLTNVMYMSFIVVVTVALINLLIGLAVHDIQGLIETSKLNKSIRLIRYMHSIESVIYSKLASFCFPRIVEWFLVRRRKFDCDGIVHIYPHTPQHRSLPFAHEALVIARKNGF